MSSLATKSAKVLIRPQRGMVGLDFRELWNFRELIVFLTWRDILVRYKQTLLGGAWAILQPLLQMLLLNLLFGEVAGLPTSGVPRPLFTFAALLPWNLFSNAVSDASRSLVANRNMITKVYFPRIIVPLANVLSGVLDFAVAFLILAGMMIYYQFAPVNLLLLPLYVLVALLTALGVGLWLAALNVHYRDVKYIIPFLTQFWMLASPIAYEAKSIFERLPEAWQWLYALNPMVGVVEGFRYALLGIPVYSENMLWVSLASSLAMLVSGLMYFRSMERTFADVV
ncbi:MAG: ABC transporter permease [Anaerolineales bacterium]|nr:MAG: ABC transporter permease [Anaerolineales bacterium]